MFRFAGTHANRVFFSSGFVSTNPEPRVTGFECTNPDTRAEAAKRSLLMGNRLFLKLTRLARSWPFTRGTADDAVLTLAILNTQSCLAPWCGPAAPPDLLQGLVDEAAEPHIHHKAYRHEHEQRGRTPVAHKR